VPWCHSARLTKQGEGATAALNSIPVWKKPAKAKAKAAKWLAKVRKCEDDMRAGAFKSFDIDIAIKQSDIMAMRFRRAKSEAKLNEG
jgi:hypothetical protein